MKAAQAGDARAYDEVLRHALPLLRTTARRRLRNPADVEDAVQDTLLTIHQLRHTYDPARPLRPWIIALCDRRCVDRARRAQKRAAHEIPADVSVEAIHDGAGADGAFARVAAAELRDSVATLSPSQSVAIRLLKLQDMSLAEASALTGRSVATLKMATHRAMHALRRRLGDDAG